MSQDDPAKSQWRPAQPPAAAVGDTQHIRSRSNPQLQALRQLARDGTAYRVARLVWLEGDHLLSALRQRGGVPDTCVVAESVSADPEVRCLTAGARRVLQVPDALFESITGLASPARIGCTWALPVPPDIIGDTATVVLDRLQDAGNVGSILRSAAAMGVTQVLALKGTAALWSPKVLRAGMGAHFGLRLIEGLEEPALQALRLPWVGSSSHAAQALHDAVLPSPCAWLFGHEGQGLAEALAARCQLQVRIHQPGGEESLNVAAAAAICLHESARRAAATPRQTQ